MVPEAVEIQLEQDPPEAFQQLQKIDAKICGRLSVLLGLAGDLRLIQFESKAIHMFPQRWRSGPAGWPSHPSVVFEWHFGLGAFRVTL